MSSRITAALSSVFCCSSKASEDPMKYQQIKNDPKKLDGFEKAIHHKLADIDSPSFWGRGRFSKISKSVNQKLKPVGPETFIYQNDDELISGHHTRIRGVFKNSGSDEFSLLVNKNKQIVQRTRKEIELHVLLQSHLKANYQDSSIRSRSVITSKDLDATSCLPSLCNPFKYFFKKRAVKETAPLLHPTTESLSADSPRESIAAQNNLVETPSPRTRAYVSPTQNSQYSRPAKQHNSRHLRCTFTKVSQSAQHTGAEPCVSSERFFGRPYRIEEACQKLLDRAKSNHETSITFPLNWIPREPIELRSGELTSRPIAQAAAIAIATVVRQATLSHPLTIHFEYYNDEDKEIYKSLLAQVRSFKEERVYQALLRPPITRPTRATSPDNFFDKERRATFVPQAIKVDADNKIVVLPTPEEPQGTLNGVAFGPANLSAHDLDKGEGQMFAFDEPAKDHIRAAGTVIVEGNGDGRVWVVQPTNQFMQLHNTFPKGQGPRANERKVHPQRTAVKETLEETGLQVELVGFLCDAGKNDRTRYYLAKRVGGTPANVEWESQAVSLVPQEQLLNLFPRKPHERDLKVANALLQKLNGQPITAE